MAAPTMPAAPEAAQQLQAPVASPQEVIRQQAVVQDYVVMRLVVTGLIIAIVLAVIGVTFLSYLERAAPEGLIAIGSGATGALATMLATGNRNAG